MLVLKKNRKFLLRPVNKPKIDIESQLPIPRSISIQTIPYDVWDSIAISTLVNIFEYIKQYFASLKHVGFRYSLNNQVWKEIAKYIYSVSSNTNKKELKKKV